jgi:hypothetical protein
VSVGAEEVAGDAHARSQAAGEALGHAGRSLEAGADHLHDAQGPGEHLLQLGAAVCAREVAEELGEGAAEGARDGALEPAVEVLPGSVIATRLPRKPLNEA